MIVDGQTLIQGGRTLRVDEQAVYERARQATRRYWQQVPAWHWGGYDIDRIIPPAFAMHRAEP